MTLRSEIRACLVTNEALSDVPTLKELFDACPSATDEKKFAANLSVLKAEGKIKVKGVAEGMPPKPVYGIAKWPASGSAKKKVTKERDPKPRKKPKPRSEKRTQSPRTATQVAPDPVQRPPGAASFAIDAEGWLGIEKDGGRVKLDPREFAELRDFTDKTAAVWGTE